MNFVAQIATNAKLFCDASPALTGALDRLARPARAPRGTMLFCQGDAADGLYQIRDGRVEISVSSADGRRVVLNVLGPGDILGEIALFDDGQRTASARVTEDCTYLKVSRGEFYDALAEAPALALEMIALAGRRMRKLSDLHEEILFLPLETRMARRLLFLADNTVGGADHVPLTQSTLAEHLNVSRELISRTLAQWRTAGLVDIGHGWLNLRDVDRVTAIAQGAAAP